MNGDKAIYLWCKSSCGDIDIEVKVEPGGSFIMEWPLVTVSEEVEDFDDIELDDDLRLRAGLPDNCPLDQRRFVADVHGWRPFDRKLDKWNPPDDYPDDDLDIEFSFDGWGDNFGGSDDGV